MKIFEATTHNHLQITADLFREYQLELNVDLCFQDFELELASLPGKYAPPYGSILLAEQQNTIIGCVAIRSIQQNICEMKRLYVKKNFRQLSAGKKLAEGAIDKAKQFGYHTMQLDTLERLQAAINLYTQLGFKQIEPYYNNPLKQVVYWQLDLLAALS